MRPVLFMAALTLPMTVACSENVPGAVQQPGGNPNAGLPFQSAANFALSQDAVDFVIQILHAADQEGGVAAIDDAPRFSAVVNGLQTDPNFPNTLVLSAGDAFIPGAFFSASGGEADIRIQNGIGFQAIALGNHEFDLGTNTLAGLIEADDDFPGTNFPYLSANLDFTTDANLAGLVVGDGTAPQPNSLAGSTVIDVNGEQFGIVGATTPRLGSISSPAGVTIQGATQANDPLGGGDLNTLAGAIQAAVDDLTGQGIDKIIALAHLQDLNNEVNLAPLLTDVDIIIGGGSDTILANEDDRIRDEFGKDREGEYPLRLLSANNEPILVVNTDREYRYVGRLAVGFDANGLLADIDDASGIVPTDDQGVADAGGAAPDPDVQAAIDEVAQTLDELDGQIFGNATVFLNGERGDVRTQETNLGNITADANLARAQQEDDTVLVSIKNGGGIRASIGSFTVGDDPQPAPTAANPRTGKQAGEISQLDIQNALRFNNSLALLTLSTTELKQIIEHAVASTGPGSEPGSFPQVGGMAFSFDATGTAIEFDADGNVVTDGTRVQSITIGQLVVVQNGQVINPDDEFRVVTLSFLAEPREDTPGLGGDGYPFPAFAGETLNVTDIGEQEALQVFLQNNSPIMDADTPPADDIRIQNLAERNDTAIGG
ncbi:MAG: 5'-nucleotidase C-terminal domain-containing protein [Cyanobacteria bacterium J06642_2]